MDFADDQLTDLDPDVADNFHSNLKVDESVDYHDEEQESRSNELNSQSIEERRHRTRNDSFKLEDISDLLEDQGMLEAGIETKDKSRSGAFQKSMSFDIVPMVDKKKLRSESKFRIRTIKKHSVPTAAASKKDPNSKIKDGVLEKELSKSDQRTNQKSKTDVDHDKVKEITQKSQSRNRKDLEHESSSKSLDSDAHESESSTKDPNARSQQKKSTEYSSRDKKFFMRETSSKSLNTVASNSTSNHKNSTSFLRTEILGSKQNRAAPEMKRNPNLVSQGSQKNQSRSTASSSTRHPPTFTRNPTGLSSKNGKEGSSSLGKKLESSSSKSLGSKFPDSTTGPKSRTLSSSETKVAGNIEGEISMKMDRLTNSSKGSESTSRQNKQSPLPDSEATSMDVDSEDHDAPRIRKREVTVFVHVGGSTPTMFYSSSEGETNQVSLASNDDLKEDHYVEFTTSLYREREKWQAKNVHQFSESHSQNNQRIMDRMNNIDSELQYIWKPIVNGIRSVSQRYKIILIRVTTSYPMFTDSQTSIGEVLLDQFERERLHLEPRIQAFPLIEYLNFCAVKTAAFVKELPITYVLVEDSWIRVYEGIQVNSVTYNYYKLNADVLKISDDRASPSLPEQHLVLNKFLLDLIFTLKSQTYVFNSLPNYFLLVLNSTKLQTFSREDVNTAIENAFEAESIRIQGSGFGSIRELLTFFPMFMVY